MSARQIKRANALDLNTIAAHCGIIDATAPGGHGRDRQPSALAAHPHLLMYPARTPPNLQTPDAEQPASRPMGVQAVVRVAACVGRHEIDDGVAPCRSVLKHGPYQSRPFVQLFITLWRPKISIG